VIDLHCHLLPAIDDGPPDLEGAMALAQDLCDAGVERVAATPHVSADHPNTAAGIRAAWAALRTELAHRRVPLDVVTGGELDALHVRDFDAEELRALQLAGGGTLLLECPFTPVMPYFEDTIGLLQRLGHRVLLAHPERSPAFLRDPGLLPRLVAGGALASLTGASFGGRFGATARRYACWAVDEGLVHDVATDAHDARNRRALLRGPLEGAGYAWAADWLTREAPSAILAGAPLPPRPAAPARRPWQRLRHALARRS
jgi:protein-tyrosine phosphatase